MTRRRCCASTRRCGGRSPPLWSYAVASHEELAKIAPRLGLFFGPDGKEIAHNLCTAIIGPDGQAGPPGGGHAAQRLGDGRLLKTIYSLLPGRQK